MKMTLRYRMMTLAASSLMAVALVAQTPPGNPAAPPAGGRGQGGRGGGGGGRRGGFTQFTRPLASQDVLARGKALYETNCTGCHAPDLRGTPNGTNLLRSGTALSDQHGELVGKAV